MPEKNYSVLLVDDDHFLLDMYAGKFKKSGHEVATASKSADALQRLRDGLKPDIILLDIIMPGMDGMELLEIIRKENLAVGAVIIMITNQGEEIERAKNLRVQGYIIKASAVPSEVVAKVTQIARDNGKR